MPISDRHQAPPRWRVAVAFACIYLIWGSTYLAIRFAIETLPPFLMAGLRFIIAGSILYLLARLRGAPPPQPRNWRGALAVGGLLLLCGNGGVVWAERRVASGLAALLVGGVPLYIALLEWLVPRGVRPSRQVTVGLLLGFAGMALLVAPGELGGLHVDPVGALVLVVASFMWALGSLYSRRAPLPDSPLLGTAMEMLSGGALLLAASALTGEPRQLDVGAVSLRSLAAFGYLVLFGSLIGFTAYIWLLRVVPATRVATYAYVNPVVAILLGWVVAGEPLAARTVLAAAVIISAVVLVTTSRVPRKVEPATLAATPAGDKVRREEGARQRAC
ncbi:MAG: drug/metabolite exporter YedA [Anaerolineae bacterium]|nr:drug/metabolite exporter YedA [Anaerolineae bacterium]